MKRLILSLAWVLLSAMSVWAQSSVWTNEPSGSTTILDCPFNSVSACGILDVYSSSVINQDASAPISQPNTVYSKIDPGASSGGMQLNWVAPQVSNEMYVGMMWRTNPQFYGRQVANKLFFIRGPQVNGFWGMNGCPGQGSPTCYLIFGHNTATLDNSQACAADLGLICNPNVSPGTITLGTWTKLEAYVKCSTTATSRDGIVRWWVNGVLTGNYTNMNYCPSGLNEWVWSETWDGTVNPVPTVRWEHWIDHLHISVPQCPSGGCTPPPPPPPPPPSPPTGGGNYVFTTQFSATQGQNQWSYRDGAGNLLTYDASGTIWRGSEQYLAIWNGGFMHGWYGGNVSPVLRWTAPSAGSAVISGSTQLYSANGNATFSVKHNGAGIFSQPMVNTTTAYPYNLTRSVSAGDTIDFSIVSNNGNGENNTQLNPIIVFTPSGGGIPAPIVSSFTPNSGDVGTTVTITGTNFSVDVSGNIVKFNGTTATCNGASTTSITCNLPQGSTTGTISVTTSSGTGTSAGTFTVTTVTPTRTVKIWFSHTGLDTAKNREVIDHFNVYRATSIAGSYSKVGEAAGTDRVYLDTSAPLGKACYKFEPVDTANNVGAQSTARCAYDGVSPDADTTNPEAPFSVVPTYQ